MNLLEEDFGILVLRAAICEMTRLEVSEGGITPWQRSEQSVTVGDRHERFPVSNVMRIAKTFRDGKKTSSEHLHHKTGTNII